VDGVREGIEIGEGFAMVDRDTDDQSANTTLSRELLGQIVVDICMLDWESISDPELQREVKRFGKHDWVCASTHMLRLLESGEREEMDSRATFSLKLLDLITNVRMLGMVLEVSGPLYGDRHMRSVRSRLDAEQWIMTAALIEKCRPSRPIS